MSAGYVDAHVHLWDPGRFTYPWLTGSAGLDRPFLAPDLLAAARSAGAPPAGVVVVEADRLPRQARAEAQWVLAASTPDLPVLGAVAHVPFGPGTGTGPATTAGALDDLADLVGLAGARRLLQDEAPGFLARPDVVAAVAAIGARGLPFDLCVRSRQLREAVELVGCLPDVEFVLDHLGKPRITADAYGPWAQDLRRLAALPNVRCKLSGLVTEADPDHRAASDLLPFLRHALDVFGPGRCLFGSDWPVLTLVTTYDHWLDVVLQAVDDLDGAARDLVMRANAVATYTRPLATTTAGRRCS
ncbi:amidohydrolase [Kineosporia sp. A_224]|uniref:amidohydrolase family protein n=1 Tax=Kineosporia sp. A_224 TaxID=1962180 RepID=UPI000B4BA579|nr:amidohydrolase family protein [Kineosporia sp. A_224]